MLCHYALKDYLLDSSHPIPGGFMMSDFFQTRSWPCLCRFPGMEQFGQSVLAINEDRSVHAERSFPMLAAHS